jgi:transposase
MNLRASGTAVSGNRCPGGEFTEDARARIVAAAASGKTHKEIAADFGTEHESTISKIIAKFKARGTTETANRRRGKEKLSPRDKRRLIREAKLHPEATYAQLIRGADISICSKTARKILAEFHMA